MTLTWLLVTDGLVLVFLKLLISWDFDPQRSLEFSPKWYKKWKSSTERQLCRRKCFVEERGQRRRARSQECFPSTFWSLFECHTLYDYCCWPCALLYCHNLPPSNGYFQGDNAPFHEANVVSNWFRGPESQNFSYFQRLVGSAPRSAEEMTLFQEQRQELPSIFIVFLIKYSSFI